MSRSTLLLLAAVVFAALWTPLASARTTDRHHPAAAPFGYVDGRTRAS